MLDRFGVYASHVVDLACHGGVLAFVMVGDATLSALSDPATLMAGFSVLRY